MEDSLDLLFSYFPILFFAIGFIGNVLVIRIVHKTRQMHTPTNYLLANMAVSDVITILLFSYVTTLLRINLARGGHLGIFWVGMCRPGLQIGTPF